MGQQKRARETQLQIMLDEQDLKATDDWRFRLRMPSRAAAIRELLRIGLNAQNSSSADPGLRSSAFGVMNNGPDENDVL